ncbi:MAG: hypothetical protein HY247_05045 [archaeon]|nr:MAG: hypothetical protein HY247_05045 [archaeon]
MSYFEAVQAGRARVKEAMDLLQSVAGPCYPLLFLKIGPAKWTPVGEESLYSVIAGKNGTAAALICDSDGNSKTMTPWVPASKAREFVNGLAERGLSKYEGEPKLPI